MSEPTSSSRRRFVQGVMATTLFGPLQVAAARDSHVVVIGAGAFGVWTATHLLRAGARVTLVDAWGPGNSRASSGGATRVIRAIYGQDRLYTEMVARAFELWLALQGAESHHLYVETGALWMLRQARSDYLEAALPICRELGFPIDQPSIEEARRSWPQVNFDDIEAVYLERRAGMLSAKRSCQILRRRFVAEGGEYRTARARPGAIEGERLKSVQLGDGGSLSADAYVFACGPWLGEVFPEVVGERVRPSRQDVLYFGPPAGDDRFTAPQLPVWVDFADRIFYGLPDVHGRGFKIADDTRGPTVDPTTLDRSPDPTAIDRARAYLAHRFPALADAPLIESRVCQYENSPDGHLILDRHPEAANLWLAGGGSGHGFKLSPTLGEMAASAVLGDQDPPATFGLSRLTQSGSEATQFDR